MAETARLTDRLEGATVLPDLGSNGPSREDLLFFMGQFQHYDTQIAEARALKKRIRSAANLRGINLQEFDRAVAEFDRDENTTLDSVRTFKRYCVLLELPIGSQIELFDRPTNQSEFSEEALLKKAHQQGYDRGVMGQNIDEQAYPPLTPEGIEHMQGWNEGQQVNLSKIKSLNELAAAAEPKKRGRQKKVVVEDNMDNPSDD